MLEPVGDFLHRNHDCEEPRVVMRMKAVKAKISSINKLEDLEECYVTEMAGILFPFLSPPSAETQTQGL